MLVMTVEKGDNPPYALKKVVQAHTTATRRLDQAVENIAWMIAHDEADYSNSEEEHQQEIQALHDYLTGLTSAASAARRAARGSGPPCLCL